MLGARVLPLFGKTAAAARSRARKIDGGLVREEGGEMALEQRIAERVSKYRWYKFRSGKTKGEARGSAERFIERKRRQFGRYARRSDRGRDGVGERNHDPESYRGDHEPFQYRYQDIFQRLLPVNLSQ